MTPHEKLANGLLSQETFTNSRKVEEQVGRVRHFIEKEQLTLHRMKWTCVGIAIVTNLLIWLGLFYLPSNGPQETQVTWHYALDSLVNTLLPAIIISGLVAFMLIHRWRLSRAEARKRLLEIESILTALSNPEPPDADRK